MEKPESKAKPATSDVYAPPTTDDAAPPPSLLSRLLSHAVALLQWAPLVVGMVIHNFKISSTVAASLAVLNLVGSFVWWKMGKRRYWPETLQCIFVVVFVALAILAWADQEHDDIYQLWASPIQMGALVIGISVSWLFGRPFTMDYVREMLNPYQMDHPMVLYVARIICGMWLCVFTLSLLCGIIGASVSSTNKTFVFLFVHPAALQLLFILAGLALTKMIQRWRSENHEKLNEKFAPQIVEWKLRHPEVFGANESREQSSPVATEV